MTHNDQNHRRMGYDSGSEAAQDLPEAAWLAIRTQNVHADELVCAAVGLYDLARVARSLHLLPDAFVSQDADLRWIEAHADERIGEHPLFAVAQELYDKRQLALPYLQ
ncbi:MAG TPA: hypothetical protein VFQ88_09425 [Nevskiaceae bacterium]|nr:hypothetical protein [Nevskiaceae bacterium]